MSATSLYVAGLDASTEIERQISLTINNLMHEFTLASISAEVADQLRTVGKIKFPETNGSYWIVELEDETCQRVKTVSFWYSSKEHGPLEWLKWTKETKGEKKIKNYLWMRQARRPQVLMTCHTALDSLVMGLSSRFPSMREHIDNLAEIHNYALSVGK